MGNQESGSTVSDVDINYSGCLQRFLEVYGEGQRKCLTPLCQSTQLHQPAKFYYEVLKNVRKTMTANNVPNHHHPIHTALLHASIPQSI